MHTQATISPSPRKMDIEGDLLCLLASPQLKDEDNRCVTPQAIPQQAQSCSTHCLAAMDYGAPRHLLQAGEYADN